MYEIQAFFLSIGLIKRQEWGYIIIASIITTPIGGFLLLLYFWIKTYNKWKKNYESEF